MVPRFLPVLWFQSTPLREGRLIRGLFEPSTSPSFNPRPCARGDVRRPASPPPGSCFNPRPCARGDDNYTVNCPVYESFNPRPCARGDESRARSRRAIRCFNPRPCARGDQGNDIYLVVSIGFQSTPLREGRPLLIGSDGKYRRFQSTPLREGRLA